MDKLSGIHRKLVEIEERRKLALSGSYVGIWDWLIVEDTLIWDDGMFRIYEVNPGEFENNYDAWKSRVHPEDFAKTEASLKHCLNDPRWRYFYRFRVKHRGQWRHVVGSGNVIRNEQGEATRMVGINILEPRNFNINQVV